MFDIDDFTEAEQEHRQSAVEVADGAQAELRVPLLGLGAGRGRRGQMGRRQA